MIRSLLVVAAFFAMSPIGPLQAAKEVETGNPEASPFDAKAHARAEVDAALARAKAGNRMALIVMGANWCHDSRALAGWLAQPHFAAMVVSRYELVYVDVGYRDRNIDIARRFGIKSIKGTPTVLIVDGNGKLLNKKDAPKWRDAGSRKAQDIYKAFAEFTPA
jgi:thioredoxin-like negative regulator of GroEL